MTQRDMAGYLDVDRTTLYNWKKKKPNLYNIIMLGFAVDETIEKVEKSLQELKTLKDELKSKRS